MTEMMESIYKMEHKFDAATECFFFHHPLLWYLTVLIGMPVLVLSAVAVSTIVIVFPIAFIFGSL